MSVQAAGGGGAAARMDRMYRRQRHIYDASRKFYLLGRDAAIDALDAAPGAAILEIGCGTGRNLVRIARTYPGARCYGLDVSSEMLATASRAVTRAGLGHRVVLAQGDATGFDPAALFGRVGFDRVVISYALSMIPPWQGVLRSAASHLAPGGVLHVVDFGDQAGLGRLPRMLLNRWLSAFAVTPRADLPDVLTDIARATGLRCRGRRRFRGYTFHGILERDAAPA